MASRCATEAQNWRTQAQWLRRESYRQFVPFGLLLPYPPTAPNPKEKNLSLLPYTPTLKPKLLKEFAGSVSAAAAKAAGGFAASQKERTTQQRRASGEGPRLRMYSLGLRGVTKGAGSHGYEAVRVEG